MDFVSYQLYDGRKRRALTMIDRYTGVSVYLGRNTAAYQNRRRN